jgi:hypothetical protein
VAAAPDPALDRLDQMRPQLGGRDDAVNRPHLDRAHDAVDGVKLGGGAPSFSERTSGHGAPSSSCSIWRWTPSAVAIRSSSRARRSPRAQTRPRAGSRRAVATDDQEEHVARAEWRPLPL